MATSVIDTLMAGRLSALDLAAVGIGASIYATVFVTAMGVLLALTPVVSHHFGAGRYTEIGADVRQCAWLAVLLSIATFTLLKNPDPLLAISRLTPDVEVGFAPTSTASPGPRPACFSSASSSASPPASAGHVR